MQVPAPIYGFYPEVKRRMRRLVPKMKRGASLEEALGAAQLIDTAEHEGEIQGQGSDGMKDPTGSGMHEASWVLSYRHHNVPERAQER
jgi:hypothetical protein